MKWGSVLFWRKIMQTGLYFSCQIGELAAETFDVVEFQLQEGLSTLFTLSLNVVSRQNDIDIQTQLLKRASLTVSVNGEEQRTVHGVVASLMQGDTGFRRTYYTITIRPHLWTLTLGQDSRIFHLSTVPEILKEILDEHSVRADSQFKTRHPQREYTTMKRESYYDFFARLAAEEGIAYWFEDKQLYYSDTHLTMKDDVDVIYNPHPQAAAQGNIINQLSYGAVMRPGSLEHKDYTYHNPRLPLSHDKEVSHDIWPQYEVFESYGRYQTDSDSERFAKYRFDSMRTDSLQGTALSNCFRLAPGKIFTLSQHSNPKMNDRWQVVTAFHHGKQPAALEEESDQTGTILTNELTFISGKLDWRPPYKYKPLADGDEIGVISGPPNEEIYTNENGAVRVHFHWNRYDEADDRSSCWIRVAQGWNGSGFGFMAIPRIGQEVIVSYLNGDIDRPIITGCNYNALNQPPLDLPKEKTRTTFKTQTHKGEGFNELRFEDEAGREEIYIHAQKDKNIHVLNDKSELIEHDEHRTIANDQTFKVGRDRRKTIGQDEIITIERDRKEHINQDVFTTIARNEDRTIQSNQREAITASQIVTIGENQNITIEGIQTIQAKTKLQAQTTEYLLQGNERLVIRGPNGKITLDGKGITLDSPAIFLNGDVSIGTGATDQIEAIQKAIQQGSPFVEECPLKKGVAS